MPTAARWHVYRGTQSGSGSTHRSYDGGVHMIDALATVGELFTRSA